MMLTAKYRSRVTLFFEKLRARKGRAKREAIVATSSLIVRETKQTLRIRPGRSAIGAVPHAHTTLGLRVIKFAVDGDSSIIGPVKFSDSNRLSEPVPSIHEFGKAVYTIGLKTVYYKYPQRPYMYPTLKRMHRKVQIPRQFSATMARVL